MALASCGFIFQKKAFTSSAFPSPRLLNRRSYSQTQSQFNLREVHRHSTGFNLASGSSSDASSSSFVTKVALSDAQTQPQIVTPTSSTGWSEFARNVSGEWDGYGADFSSEGTPVELPESVVPEAYREWEVKVFDWQTQCPTLAKPEEPSFMYKNIKLLPTVGCEADAATRYSVDERNIDRSLNDKLSAFAYQSSGCYVAISSMENHGAFKLMELEHCLINPRDRESRVRIIQVVHLEGTKMVLRNIRVFCEQWYGPFRNGDQLGGCAIRDSAFASTAAIKASEVAGTWQGNIAITDFDGSQKDTFCELLGNNLRKLVRSESDLTLLPKQLWCSVKESEEGSYSCEVGWLFDHRQAISSRCVFSSTAKLKEISIGQETIECRST